MDNLAFDSTDEQTAPGAPSGDPRPEGGQTHNGQVESAGPVVGNIEAVEHPDPESDNIHTSIPLGAVPISPIPPLINPEKNGSTVFSAPPEGDIEQAPQSGVRSRSDSRVVPKTFDKSVDSGPPEEGEEEDYSLLSCIPAGRKLKDIFDSWKKSRWPRVVVVAVLLTLYSAYLIAVLSISSSIEHSGYWCRGDGFLLILTLFGATLLVYFQIIKKYFGSRIYKSLLKPGKESFDKCFELKPVRIAFYACLVSIFVLFLLVDTHGNRVRLQSLIGVIFLLLMGFVFSAAPRKVVWRHVIWGMGLQFVLGIFILRFPVGRAIFSCSGDKIQALLAFTDKGSGFVFGSLIGSDSSPPIFAFYVLPVILFFSFLVQILYYYGIMQWVVIKIGWLLQVTIGTTACESVNAAANIFLGMSEAPLMIKPFIPIMTKSELHAVLTGGFATIAGSVLAAYISFGISASHLLSASVMSAPAALAYAKLFYPETGISKTNARDISIVRSTEVNALHAAIEGVVAAIPLVANVAANLIAFIAFIALFNAVFNWSCLLVDIEDGFCSLENISGYIFMPLAWMMGVQWSDCHQVGTLIGIKTIVNEFVGYSTLAKMVEAGEISVRSEIIATYALCGFSNIASIGIQMGAIGSLAPERRADIAKIVVRAMIAGSAACFLTGCVAGTLIDDFSARQDLNNTFT